MTTYHVGIPYYYHFYVEADTEEEAIEKAHNSEGSMGEYDENNIFVETVTFRGGTIKKVLGKVKEIHSIELSKTLYKQCVETFKNNKNVHLYHGASEYELPKVLKKIKERCVFWLDSHYSRGITALGEKECPLLEELDAIANHHIKNHIILIDDTRHFGYVGKSGWQDITTEKVKEKIININPDYIFTTIDGEIPNDILVAEVSNNCIEK